MLLKCQSETFKGQNELEFVFQSTNKPINFLVIKFEGFWAFWHDFKIFIMNNNCLPYTHNSTLVMKNQFFTLPLPPP